MTEPSEGSMQERVERLEQSVARVERILATLAPRLAQREGLAGAAPDAETRRGEGDTSAAPPLPLQSARPLPRARSPRTDLTPSFVGSLSGKGMDFWFSRVGIGLVLLAVAFLFKYSIDRGWLTPWVRSGIGLAVGGVLYGVGARVRERRRIFAHLMLGGGSVALYTTGFAAFQILELVSYPAAMSFMVAVTLATLVLAVREDSAELAVLGALGGFMTPFLLFTPEGSVPGLVTYTCVIIAGMTGIYLFKGWRESLWTTVLGGTTVILVALAGRERGDAPAVQLGLGFLLVAFWAIPVLREILAARDPARWPVPPPQKRRMAIGATDTGIRIPHVALLTVGIPVLGVFFSSGLWQAGDRWAGWAAVALAAAMLGMWSWIRGGPLSQLATAHVASAAALVGVAVPLLLSGNAMLIAWAVEGLVLHVFARRIGNRTVAIVAHCVMVVPLAAVPPRLLELDSSATPMLNPRALTDLSLFAAAIAASRFLRDQEGKVYLLAAYAGVLAWLWRELVPLNQGQAQVTGAWGLLGICLLLAGLRSGQPTLRHAGTATLFLVVAKLFFVDLANVDALVRIVLFMVFGGVFLAIGYFFPALWRSENNDPGGS